jgi:hypothetical protein
MFSHSIDTENSGLVRITSLSPSKATNSGSGIKVGTSLVIVPLTTGIGDNKLCAIVSAIFVLACPICPTKRISCPESIALFKEGTTSLLNYYGAVPPQQNACN